MTSEKNSILEKIKKIYFQVLPVSVFFYITLTTYFPRNCYKFVKTETIENNIKPKITKLEKLSKIKLRKKLIIDLKFHDTSLNWSRKNVTKLLLNPEGKIIGYKKCGRSSRTGKYPLCRPSRKVSGKTPKLYKNVSPSVLRKARKDKSRRRRASFTKK
jgi:hypothetical protein